MFLLHVISSSKTTKKEHKKLPPLWDESCSHVLPPKFPMFFAKHRLCRSFDRPLTLDHASALRQQLLNHCLHARKRFLRDHIPSSSQTGSQLIRLSALGVCLYLSLHWKSYRSCSKSPLLITNHAYRHHQRRS